MLDRLMNEYNKTVHGTLGTTPIKCSKLKNHEMKSGSKIVSKPKFKIDDKVRIGKVKGNIWEGISN